MTVRSRAAKKSRRAHKSMPTPSGSTGSPRADTGKSPVETWVLGLQLRALHLENAHGTGSEAGQYAFGVAVACRQAIGARHVMVSDHLADDLTTPAARFGYDDAAALVAAALDRSEPPTGEFHELLRGLHPVDGIPRA